MLGVNRVKMLKILRRGSDFSLGRIPNRTLRRLFLSNAYKCTEVWENRLKYPEFKKIDFENVYHELDQCFREKTRINVLDIDLFATCLTDYQFKNELEHILINLRECPESAILPERTSHAIIRLYMDSAPKEDLFNILSNRIEYGMFPDNFLNNIMMDKFLKENDSVSAVKIAVLQMLQEDVSHPITKVLALYCCYNYLASTQVWEVKKLPEPDPDEEVVKVRVNFIRNPYYDDHFDIINSNHLVGKTLWMFGISVGGTLGASSQLVGLILHEKYEQSASFLEKAIEDNIKLHGEAVSMAMEYLAKAPKQIAEEKNEETDSTRSSKDTGEDSWKSKVVSLLEKLDKGNLIDGKLLEEAEKLAEKAVQANQEGDIAHQSQLYKQWEKDRLANIESEIKRCEREKLKLTIQKVKEELKAEEEKLFYFDNEESLEMTIKNKEERMKTVVYYKGKKKDAVQEDYVPPDVNQRKN